MMTSLPHDHRLLKQPRRWMQTHTGKKVYPTSIKPAQIDIKDIAHALAMICRFGGHCKFHYSVAQHSVLVAEHLEQCGHDYNTQLYGLLHDAPEAYLGDMLWPLKANVFLNYTPHAVTDQFVPWEYMELHIADLIAAKFELPLSAETKDVVKQADMRMLATEKRDVMLHPRTPEMEWELIKDIEPYREMCSPVRPEYAEIMFLERFEHLTLMRQGGSNG